MSRLYDRMIRPRGLESIHTDSYGEPAFDHETMRAMLKGRTVISLDNVSNYFWENWEKGWSFADFPTLAPPWDVFFAEWKQPKVPSFMQSESVKKRTEDGEARLTEHGGFSGPMPDAYGALVVAHDVREEEKYKELLVELPSARWDLMLFLFAEYERVTFGPIGRLNLLLDDQGILFGARVGKISATASVPGGFPSLNAELMCRDQWISSCMPLFLGLSLANCKNVQRKENVPAPKVSKKHERRYGNPSTRYYTLEIATMTDSLEKEGGVSQNGLKKALHICRGHFATYAPEKPLFGKYSGTFWKPQHVKGNKKHGEVVKDYAVKAPHA